MYVSVLPALQDNYVYLACDEGSGGAIVVDPGEAEVVLAALAANPKLSLQAVLITHHHYDHVDGVAAIRQHYPNIPIYAPTGGSIDGAQVCADGDELSLLNGALSLRAIATPGHTAEHLCWYAPPLLFCGDTLFLGGCGRVRGGLLQAQYESLMKLSALPDDTRIYCGHEYTRANLKFAMAVEPSNDTIAQRYEVIDAALKSGQASVPSNLAAERLTNPFLRVQEDAVRRAAEQHAKQSLPDAAAVFATLRRWKDSF